MSPSEAQRHEAMLHATAWEKAADNLSRHSDSDPSMIERRMGVTIEQIRTLKWLAVCMASSYRQIANGDEIVE